MLNYWEAYQEAKAGNHVAPRVDGWRGEEAWAEVDFKLAQPDDLLDAEWIAMESWEPVSFDRAIEALLQGKKVQAADPSHSDNFKPVRLLDGIVVWDMTGNHNVAIIPGRRWRVKG